MKTKGKLKLTGAIARSNETIDVYGRTYMGYRGILMVKCGSISEDEQSLMNE